MRQIGQQVGMPHFVWKGPKCSVSTSVMPENIIKQYYARLAFFHFFRDLKGCLMTSADVILQIREMVCLTGSDPRAGI